MHQQVALVASSVEGGSISTWCVTNLAVRLVFSVWYRNVSRIRRDVETGTLLATYKTNSSPRHGFCRLGRDYLIGAQLGKGSLHFWTWHKARQTASPLLNPLCWPILMICSAPAQNALSQRHNNLHCCTVYLQDHVLQRAFTLEPVRALAATADGVYVAGGGASGTIYIWATGSGQLVRSWPAHYKVTDYARACAYQQYYESWAASPTHTLLTLLLGQFLHLVVKPCRSMRVVHLCADAPAYTRSSHRPQLKAKYVYM